MVLPLVDEANVERWWRLLVRQSKKRNVVKIKLLQLWKGPAQIVGVALHHLRGPNVGLYLGQLKLIVFEHGTHPVSPRVCETPVEAHIDGEEKVREGLCGDSVDLDVTFVHADDGGRRIQIDTRFEVHGDVVHWHLSSLRSKREKHLCEFDERDGGGVDARLAGGDHGVPCLDDVVHSKRLFEVTEEEETSRLQHIHIPIQRHLDTPKRQIGPDPECNKTRCAETNVDPCIGHREAL
mmetsp:Transcript_21920/g.47688  ORF Transcript_21920/g.47688 Transcript_21920/m.47688 type:complete len:237 (-) Transcript_21920:788-1498(-)